MATVSDIINTPLSGLKYIDALLDSGPDWNFFTTNGNTLYYTFSMTSGLEDAASTQTIFTGSAQALSAAQQAWVRELLKDGGYLNQLTGIHFAETSNGTDAQIHLANANLIGSTVTGLCSWHSPYSYTGDQLNSYDADAYVYLDNIEWGSENGNLTPGTEGYQTLLHEVGHALGLKHPFYDPGLPADQITLPTSQDNTSNTLMSYTRVGGPYSQYSQYDVAALKWLYGGDGLRGDLGINSTTGGRYLAGTSGAETLKGTEANDRLEGDGGNDILEGDGGNDMIDGGDGTDTAVFRGVRSNYTFTVLPDGSLQSSSKDGIDGTDTLVSIEVFKFADMTASQADVVGADTTPPIAPDLVVTKNGNDYVTTGRTPVVNGSSEANATINVYTDAGVLIGTTKADANGVWSVTTSAFKDGTGYKLYATATDAAGNTSPHSVVINFNIDAVAPTIPTANIDFTAGSNVATFGGRGEPGTMIELMRAGDLVDIAATTVGTDGTWKVTTSPLPNGTYEVITVSSDLAENSTSAANHLTFTVSNPNNMAGTDKNDSFKPTAGNNAIDGGKGIDTAVYDGARANYDVAKETWGYGVTDHVGNNGHDALIDVERVQFSDMSVALDINGTAGQIYRIYQAVMGRASEPGGQGFWMWSMETQNTSILDVAHNFMLVKEFTDKYGTNSSDADFITKLYANVMHRAPDQGGFKFWMDAIEVNHISREEVLLNFADSLENKAQVIASIQNGIDFIPYHPA